MNSKIKGTFRVGKKRPCDHDFSDWEITKTTVHTETKKRLCKKCWLLEKETERGL